MERMRGITYPEGYVYCLREINTGRHKIGSTADDPRERTKQLYSTGMSDSLEFIFCIYVKDYIKIEKKIHKILEDNGLRYKKNREFFITSENDIYTIFTWFLQNNNNIIFNNTNLKKRDYNEDNDIEMIDSNTYYNPNNKKRKIRKLNNFKDGQKIRHIIILNDYYDIWEGIYNKNDNNISYMSIKYTSITSFATAHYRANPCKKNNCKSGWMECEYYENDKWISTSTL